MSIFKAILRLSAQTGETQEKNLVMERQVLRIGISSDCRF